MLIKTYKAVFYWYTPDFNYTTHLTSQPAILPYIEEPQGEAICFDSNGKNYYTISERLNASLYIYQRLGDNDNNGGISRIPSVIVSVLLLHVYASVVSVIV